MASQPAACLTVCLTGAEATGKTTLAAALAEVFDAPCVPEVARSYLMDLTGTSDYTADDVLTIAEQQFEAERRALGEAPPLLICDTDLLVIRIWWEVKFGELHPWLRARLDERTPRCYLLTAPDIPWEADPLRESGGERDGLHEQYRQALAGGAFPYLEVRGSEDERLALAQAEIERWRSLS